MLIDAIEYSNKLKQEIESNEERFDEIEKQETSLDQTIDMAKNLGKRAGLQLAMRILVDMMEKADNNKAVEQDLR